MRTYYPLLPTKVLYWALHMYMYMYISNCDGMRHCIESIPPVLTCPDQNVWNGSVDEKGVVGCLCLGSDGVCYGSSGKLWGPVPSAGSTSLRQCQGDPKSTQDAGKGVVSDNSFTLLQHMHVASFPDPSQSNLMVKRKAWEKLSLAEMWWRSCTFPWADFYPSI